MPSAHTLMMNKQTYCLVCDLCAHIVHCTHITLTATHLHMQYIHAHIHTHSHTHTHTYTHAHLHAYTRIYTHTNTFIDHQRALRSASKRGWRMRAVEGSVHVYYYSELRKAKSISLPSFTVPQHTDDSAEYPFLCPLFVLFNEKTVYSKYMEVGGGCV